MQNEGGTIYRLVPGVTEGSKLSTVLHRIMVLLVLLKDAWDTSSETATAIISLLWGTVALSCAPK